MATSKQSFVLVLIACWHLAATGSTAAQVPGEASSASQLYHQGRLLEARDLLAQALSRIPASDPAQRRDLLAMLVDNCVAAGDAICAGTYTPELTQLLPPHELLAEQVSADPGTGLLLHEFQLQKIYYLWRTSLLLGAKNAVLEQAEEAYLGTRRESPYYPLQYVRRQFLESELFLLRDRREEARDALDRALSMILAVDLQQIDRWSIASQLSELFYKLLQAGDPLHALRVHDASLHFIEAHLAPQSLEAFELRFRQAALALETGAFQSCVVAARDGLERLETLSIDPEYRGRLGSELSSVLAFACLMSGDADCLNSALQTHPAEERLSAAVGSGTFSQGDELILLALRVLRLLREGQEIPESFIDLLRSDPGFQGRRESVELLGIYRASTLALALAARRERNAPVELRTAARLVIDHVERRWQANGTALFLTPGPLRVIIGSILLGLAQNGDAHDYHLALRLGELYNRDLRDADADSAAWIRSAESEVARDAIHATVRLTSRQRAYEYQQLAGKLEQGAWSDQSDKRAEMGADLVNHKIRSHLGQYSERRIQLRKIAGSPATIRNLADASTLQLGLASNEAYLLLVAVGPQLIHTCVTRSSGQLRWTTIDSQAFERSARLFADSLTATHRPSALLDAQFPATAAVSLFEAMIRPVDNCLSEAKHITWSATYPIGLIPIAALLRKIPKELQGGGYDLATASWLVNDFSLASVSSVGELLAHRSMEVSLRPVRSFLGVGAPSLSGRMKDGDSRSEHVLRGVVASSTGSIEQLAPLPEAARELAEAAKHFPVARVLVGEDAAESDLRRELIRGYDYLAFSTHGLVREEVPGLREPALVLTPRASEDAFDNGLLTASEIADLKLDSSLAVLSACNTANFDYLTFDAEVRGLTSAFAIAGVPATIASLWPLETNAAQQIVSGLYRRLGEDRSAGASEALALAQRELLRVPPTPAYRHPRFWAALALFGDGATKPGARARANDSPFTPLQAGESEGMRLVPDPEGGGWYAIGISDPEGGVHGTFISRIDSAGRVLWAKREPDLGATRYAEVSHGRIVAAGYMPLDGQGGAIPVVFAYEATGRRLWKVPLNQYKGYLAHPLGLSLRGEGKVLVVGLRGYQQDGSRAYQLFAAELDSGGGILTEHSWNTELTKSAVAGFSGVAGDVLIIGAAEMPGRITKWAVDASDAPKACFQWRRNLVARIDLSSWEIGSIAWHENLEIVDAIWKGSRLFVAGTRFDGCSTDEAIAFGELDLKDLSLRILYEDVPTISSNARGLSDAGEALVIVGGSERELDVGSGAAPSNLWGRESSVAFNPRSPIDGVIIRVDKEGRLLNRELVKSGSDVWLMDGVFLGSRMLATGSVGGQAMYGSISLSSAD